MSGPFEHGSETTARTLQPRPIRLAARLRSQLAAAAVAVIALVAPSSWAGDAITVELFTSQGCSSCPPADHLLGELAERPELVALSYNVDYWDYLGWKDRLASPEHTQRQRAYARKQHARTIYTPQIVVGGRTAVIGSRADDVDTAIKAQMAEPSEADVALSVKDGGLHIVITPTSPVAMPCDIILVSYQRRVEERIRRGENAGQTIVYHNVVRDLTSLGEWSGAKTQEFDRPLNPEMDGYAVMLQAGEGGPILAATRLEP